MPDRESYEDFLWRINEWSKLDKRSRARRPTLFTGFDALASARTCMKVLGFMRLFQMFAF